MVSIDMSSDAKKIAAGDEFGKIYIIYNFLASESS